MLPDESVPVTDTETLGLGIIVESIANASLNVSDLSDGLSVKQKVFIELSTVTYGTFSRVVKVNLMLLSVHQLVYM